MTTEPGLPQYRHFEPTPTAPLLSEAADGGDDVHPARLWALAMAAAIVCGLMTWIIGERTVGLFEPPPRPTKARGHAMNRPSFENRVAAELKNATLTFGVFGAGLGLAMGLAGGLGRRAPRAAMSAAAFGLVLGGTAGGVASAAVLPFYYRKLDVAQEALSHDLILPFLVHAGIWSSVAATAGLAFGIGLRSRQRLTLVALHGLLGGLLGAAIYEILAALAFPTGRTTEPLAGAWAPRLIGRMTVSIASAALFVPWALSSAREARFTEGEPRTEASPEGKPSPE
jgi:hypothetical protein